MRRDGLSTELSDKAWVKGARGTKSGKNAICADSERSAGSGQAMRGERAGERFWRKAGFDG